MKIAIAQTEIHPENPEANWLHAKAWTIQAASKGADIIVFPEMSFTGFSENVMHLASLGTTAKKRIRQLAQQQKIMIGFGWVSATLDGMGENHYSLVGRTGTVLLDYVKIHPFSYCGEDRYYQKGTHLCHAMLDGMPVSTLICYDLRFPEVFRLAADQASLIFVPANWHSRRSSHWDILLRARAIENQTYILGVNCVGTQNTYHFTGGSRLINPEGEILADCGNKEQLQYIDVPSDLTTFRTAFPTWQDTQRPLYTRLYEKSLEL